MEKIGLTLGKYAPLHKGHQLVIETMLREMDRAIVMIYNTDVTPIPLRVRANWIRVLYPQVTVVEAWDGPKGEPHDPTYQQQEEAYIRTLLGGIEISAFYCSEFYGAHVARSLGAADRRVDEARQAVPVSATMIRGDAYRYRDFVDPLVYRDLIVKIVFVGAMSTGKSTITQALAERYQTTFASEYGRDYWHAHQKNRRLALEEFDLIARGHQEQEEAQLQQANRDLFVDTNAITTYMFSLDYCGKATPLLTQMALENASRYDLFFLCQDDIPYDDTWDRSGDQKRGVFQRQIIQDLNTRKIPYILLYGNLQERMQQVERVLSIFRPYNNYYGN